MAKLLMVLVALFGLALAYPGGYGGGGHGNANYGPHAGYGGVHKFGYDGPHSPHDDCDGTYGHGNHHDSFGTHNADAHAHYTKPGAPHDIGFDRHEAGAHAHYTKPGAPHDIGFDRHEAGAHAHYTKPGASHDIGFDGAHHGGYGHQSASADLEAHHSHHGTHHPGGY